MLHRRRNHSFMLRRQFFRSFLALAGLLPGASIARPAQTRAILLQTSPVAGFQYHAGETPWPLLCEGHALDLTSSANRPTLTTKKPCASNGEEFAGPLSGKFLRQNRLQDHCSTAAKSFPRASPR